MGNGEYRTLDPSNQSRSVRYKKKQYDKGERWPPLCKNASTNNSLLPPPLLQFRRRTETKRTPVIRRFFFRLLCKPFNPYRTRIINSELSGHHGSPSRHTQIRGISRRGVFEANSCPFLLVTCFVCSTDRLGS